MRIAIYRIGSTTPVFLKSIRMQEGYVGLVTDATKAKNYLSPMRALEDMEKLKKIMNGKNLFDIVEFKPVILEEDYPPCLVRVNKLLKDVTKISDFRFGDWEAVFTNTPKIEKYSCCILNTGIVITYAINAKHFHIIGKLNDKDVNLGIPITTAIDFVKNLTDIFKDRIYI